MHYLNTSIKTLFRNCINSGVYVPVFEKQQIWFFRAVHYFEYITREKSKKSPFESISHSTPLILKNPHCSIMIGLDSYRHVHQVDLETSKHILFLYC